jgi:serine/threonine-protein kinase RsbW
MEEPVAARGDREVSLTIPAKPGFLVLARLALSAVCRLTPLTPDEVADLKLAITEAANDFVDDSEPADDDEEARLQFSFRLLPDRLLLELEGTPTNVPMVEQELGRAIIDATVDECDFGPRLTRLVKYIRTAGRGAAR